MAATAKASVTLSCNAERAAGFVVARQNAPAPPSVAV
jgi:hypothetical protein